MQDNRFTLSADLPDRFGQRTFVARQGELEHRDFFRADSAFRRDQFCERVIELFQLDSSSQTYMQIHSMLEEVVKKADQPNSSDHRQPILRCFEDIQSEPIEWLWSGRVALGKLTLLCGDPGLGKSLVSLDMAARVSTGAPWPESFFDEPSDNAHVSRCDTADDDDRPVDGMEAPPTTQRPGHVLLISAEDDAADTIRPRLEVLGADFQRITALEGVQHRHIDGQMQSQPFSLGETLDVLDIALQKQPDYRLLVIDPISSYLGNVDSHRNSDVRSVLAPLAELAEKHRVAVVAVTHLNKSNAGPAVHRAMGSIAFAAAARAVWSITKDPAEPERRLMLPVKNNLARDTGGLAYQVVATGPDQSPRVRWEGRPIELTADEALRGSTAAPNRSLLEQAADWLAGVIDEGERPTTEIMELAEQAGIGRATLRRAKDLLGLQSKHYGDPAHWVWMQPPEAA